MKFEILFIFLFLCSSILSQDKDSGLAISLKNLQECLKKKSCPENYKNLFGMKNINGFIIEENEKDFIIFGEIDGNLAPLYLDDFVVALKNAFFKYSKISGNTIYYENPGCSIDPREDTIKKLLKIGEELSKAPKEKIEGVLKEWKNTCQEEQNVRVLGIPFDTRFAKIMVEADYYMKRIVDGSVNLKIEGFLSLTDMELEKIKKSLDKNENVILPPFTMNRFWFYPGEVKYSDGEDTIILDKCSVILLTEEEYISKQGKVSGKGKENLYAKAFSENFSSFYDKIAKKEKIYLELYNLFKFVAISKIAKEKTEEQYFNYFLENFQEEKIEVPRNLSGISNSKEFTYKREFESGYTEYYFWLPTCGGVSIDIEKDKMKIIKKNNSALKSKIILARKSKKQIFWNF